MIKPLALVALLCTPLPAFAQSKVYTNADLSSGHVTFPAARTPEAAVQILQMSHSIVDRTHAGSFALDPFGPRVVVVPWSGDALPLSPSIFGSSAYADALWSDPVSAYALQHPIEAAYGTYHPYGATHPRIPRVRPLPIAPAPISAPPRSVSTGSARGAGRRVR